MDDKLFLFLGKGSELEEQHRNSLHETFGSSQYLGLAQRGRWVRVRFPTGYCVINVKTLPKNGTTAENHVILDYGPHNPPKKV